MKKILIGLVVVVILLIGAVVALPFFIDVNAYKPTIEAKAKEALGRELKLNGPIKLSIWPNIGVEASDVHLANVPGGQAKEIASLKSLVVSVKLMPLLSKTVEVDSFVLNEPVINLEVDKAGKPNWQFGDQKAAPAAKPGAAGGAPSGTLKLGDVRLVNGKVGYANLQTGDKQQLDQINAKVSLPSMDSPFKLDGSAVWNKEKVDLDIGTGPLAKLQAGQNTPVKAKIASKLLTLEFDGNATVKETSTAASGAVSLDSPSIKDLAAWTGKPLQNVQPNTMGKLSIKGKLALAGKKLDFTDAKIAVDAINATGALSVDANAAKPVIKGNLDVDKLDANPYLGPEQPAKPAPAGHAGGGDWSDDPIDVSALKTFDADLAASAGQVMFRKMKTGKATVKLAVKDGRMALDLGVPKPGLYQGEGTVNVVVNAAQSPAAYEVKAKLAGLQAEPYLKDAQDTDRLSGTLGADASITARGGSQRQIVSATNGSGMVKFTDGAIKGIDLAGVARQLGEAGKGAGTFDPSRMMGGFKNLFGGGGASEKTDFAELGGTFTIVNGIITNKDLALKSPFVRVTGAGIVSMPPKTMDYKINISAVSSTQGQGGQDSGGVGIPVNCKGPWSGDSCKPDLAGMFMGDPSKLMKGMGGMGGMGGAAGAMPKGMPGGGAMPSGIPGMGGGTSAPAQQAPAPAPAPSTGGTTTKPSGGFGGFKLPGQ